MPVWNALQVPVGLRDKGERLKIEWLGEWPKETKPAVERALAGLEWLVPSWCHSLALRWDCSEDAHVCAETSTNVAYRWATIRIRPSWLSETDGERRATLVHELLHVATAPLIEAAGEIADRFVKEHAPAAYDYAREQLSSANEAAVCDLTAIITARLDGAKKR
jgi:hypothetical protein